MRKLASVLAVVLIIAVGVLAAYWLVKTKPKPARTKIETKPVIVETIVARQKREEIKVVGMGTVLSAETVVLQPQVSGRIIKQSPKLVPGGVLKKGEVIAEIDPRDYVYAVEQRKADVERARFELKVEEGRKAVAEREWALLRSEVTTAGPGRELALREPHIKNAKAALNAALYGLKLAELNLERTKITAPFNALVLEESVDMGQLVTAQSKLATLAGTDRFWVQVAIPINRLTWVSLPSTDGTAGSKATVIHAVGNGLPIVREGSITRLLGDLDSVGRLARLLVTVNDPLELDKKDRNPGLPLLLGSYVRVEIEGKVLSGVYCLPRKALREGDRLWIMDENTELAVRKVEIAWRRENSVVVTRGIRDGEKIIVSRIPAPVPGMKLRTAQQDSPPETEPENATQAGLQENTARQEGGE